MGQQRFGGLRSDATPYGIGKPTHDRFPARHIGLRELVLRDSDWDCIDESEYFDQFPQEMLGMDDRQYRRYLNDSLRDTDPDEYGYAELVAKLDALNKKMEEPVNGSG